MFRFRLQSLLDHRERIEEKLQIEISIMMKKLRDEKDKLENYHLCRKIYAEELNNHHKKGVSVGEINIYIEYLKGMASKIERQLQVVSKATQEKNQKRAELIKAFQDRRVLELMKKKAWAIFVNEVEKKEGRYLDELATRRYVDRLIEKEENLYEEP